VPDCSYPGCFFCVMKKTNPVKRRASIAKFFKDLPGQNEDGQVPILHFHRERHRERERERETECLVIHCREGQCKLMRISGFVFVLRKKVLCIIIRTKREQKIFFWRFVRMCVLL
jgi:hypothetical protein